jgi:hypothetical protein
MSNPQTIPGGQTDTSESPEEEARKKAKEEENVKIAKAKTIRQNQEYIVHIELTDQNNNVFNIDNTNHNYGGESNIMLKDAEYSTGDVSGYTIKMNRDNYYIDSSVIQELRQIFKNLFKTNYIIPTPKDPNMRYPTDISDVQMLMSNTTNFVELHKVFTSKHYIRIIKDNIINFSSGAYQNDRRIAPINRNDIINRIVSDNYKYINNSKKTADFNDDEMQDALMFNNIMYILKNIFLKRETILINIQCEKFYVDEISLYDLPFIHMKKKDYTGTNKNRIVNIYLKVKTTPIIDIPTLKIHYIIDDLEISSIKTNAPTQLYPKDLNAELANFNMIYLFNKIRYKKENDNINAFFQSMKNEKRVNNNLEVFVNADIVNKYNKKFTKKSNNSNNTSKCNNNNNGANDDNDSNKDAPIISENIVYLLREKFNLFDNQLQINNNLIDDTYIAFKTSKQAPVTYHSIMTNKKYTKYDNPKKNQTITTILEQHLKKYESDFSNNNFFYIDKSNDPRLHNVTYNIVVIFRTYKNDGSNKKPSIARRFIADECLSKAGTLDNIFSKLFYRSFGLPDKFLYVKLSNMNKNAIASASNAISSATNAIANTTNATKPINEKKGGKKYSTKKYSTKKYSTKKYSTKKYNTKKYNTKKYNTKKYNTKKYSTKKYSTKK